jgi:hypothetical protein
MVSTKAKGQLQFFACWPCSTPEFDSPHEGMEWDICQLISGTKDGFPEIESQVTPETGETGPDPPEFTLDWDFCQLIPNTEDGFPEIESQLPPNYESTF